MKFFLLIYMLSALNALGQFNESFSDGNFTTAPAWNGHTAEWQVILNSDVASGATSSNTLRLAAPTGAGTKYLSTQITGSWGLQQRWGFWLGRRAQAATASNVVYVWLYANEEDLTSATVDGYRIRFGDDAGGDELVLESVTNNAGTAIISSSGAVTNGITDYGFLVRVVRSLSGTWTLYTSTLPVQTGTGAIATDPPDDAHASITQGSVTNSTFTNFDGGFVGIEAFHTSAAAARAGVEFDQLSVAFAENGPLPVRFGNISAEQVVEGIRLHWNNMTETDISGYEVERSEEGQQFNVIEKLNPKMNDGGRSDYEYLDRKRVNGNNFYRIRVIEGNGRMTYSPIVRVFKHAVQGLHIFPNPVSSDHILLEVLGLPPGSYELSIINMYGQLLKSGVLQSQGSLISQSQPVDGLAPGQYILRVAGPVILEKKFVVQ